jgi:hypothetical protein
MVHLVHGHCSRLGTLAGGLHTDFPPVTVPVHKVISQY